MRRIIFFSNTFLTLLLSSCATSTPQTPLEVVTVYSTSAATPWLDEVYACAESVAVIERISDAASADISLRVGEPKYLQGFAYQIDEEEILVVTHRQSPIQNLMLDEVQVLFSGFGNPSVEVWVYAPDEDMFEVFDQFVMKGRSVSSSAMMATTAQQISDILNTESNAVGILPRHWKAGDTRDVYTVATVPVLAIAQNEPQGAVNQVIGCLQK